MDNLLQNRLFLQYLSAAGQDIGSGNPIGTNVNKVTEQNIGAQSQAKLNEHYMKMLASILKGEVPAGGKMTMDETGTKFQIPHMSKETNPDPGFSLGGKLNLPNAPSENVVPQMSMSNILNPSDSQPGITGADLAGLGPQDVSRALAGALDVQALMSKIPALQADVMYKKAMAVKALTPKDEPLDRKFPIEVSGVGAVTQRQWNSLPDDEKRYSAYVHVAKQLGDSDIMSKKEFEDLKSTDQERFLRHAIEDPKLKSIWLEGKTAATKAADRPDKVTWTTATKELTKRFGKLDPTGMWAVTPDLQYAHRLSQQILTELRDQGMEPLKAVNEAENRSRKKQQSIENRYRQYINAAKQISSSSKRDRKIEEIKSLFYERYGYLPSETVR